MAFAKLSKRELVLAALAGENAGRVPISLWGHFPSDPHRSDDLVAETLKFQRQFDWDFVKLMPSGMYYPEALGCTLTPASGPGAVNGLANSVIKQPSDWAALPVLDPHQGWLGEHLRSVKLVREALGPDILIIESIFSPLTVAHKLCLHLAFADQVTNHRAALEIGLRAIAEGTKRFAAACLDAGADGFFFATQEPNAGTLSREDYLALGKRFDLDVLGAVADRCSFNLLHVCQTEIYADLVADYPVHSINWDASNGRPNLTEARLAWPGKTLLGGLDRDGAINLGTPDEAAADVRRAVAEAGRDRFIVGASCALRVARPDANLLAARAAVESL